MKYGTVTALFAAGLLLVDANTLASEVLRYNPFEQPDMTDGHRGGYGNTTAVSGMELRGTLVDGHDSMANIDGEYYRLNQEVSGFRIVGIDSGSVTLTRAGNETVLTLEQDEQ